MPTVSKTTDHLLVPRKIGDLLLYRLSFITRSTSLPMVRLFEGELGITRRQWHLLALIAEHGEMTTASIAASSWLDRPQISRGLNGLLELDLVARRKTESRVLTYRVSSSGALLYHKAFERVARFNAELARLLNDQELRVLDRALTRLQGRVSAMSNEIAKTFPSARRSAGKR